MKQSHYLLLFLACKIVPIHSMLTIKNHLYEPIIVKCFSALSLHCHTEELGAHCSMSLGKRPAKVVSALPGEDAIVICDIENISQELIFLHIIRKRAFPAGICMLPSHKPIYALRESIQQNCCHRMVLSELKQRFDPQAGEDTIGKLPGEIVLKTSPLE